MFPQGDVKTMRNESAVKASEQQLHIVWGNEFCRVTSGILARKFALSAINQRRSFCAEDLY
jgi:hypothetical protein